MTKGLNRLKIWGGGTKDQKGVYTMSWPIYHPVVKQFFQIVSNECWCDNGYLSDDVEKMLSDDKVIKNASLYQIKTMLTFCVRGERFCDGHWAAMIEQGYIYKLLERLSELKVALK